MKGMYMHHKQLKTFVTILALAGLLATHLAAAAPPPAAMSGVQGGLAVQVGLDGQSAGNELAALRVSDSYVVHGLDTDSDVVERVRTSLRNQGVYGGVSADTFDGVHLPYVDNLVNLIVLSRQAPFLSGDEVVRVLAPRGVALIPSGLREQCPGLDRKDVADGWCKYVKPVPEETDEWPHYLRGPDNNAVAEDTVVGPPRHLQWVAGPEWTRNHHNLNSISASVTATGRLFCIVDEATAANMGVPGKWALTARDAYNGVHLWRKPLASWAWHKIRFRSGPPQVSRLLVASSDRVYAPLGLSDPITKMDALTGETLATYKKTTGAEEMILVNNVLLVLTGSPVAEHATQHPIFDTSYQFPARKTLVAVNTDTGEVLWEWSAREMVPRPETLASDGERAYLQIADGVLALDLENGEPLWTYGDISQKKRHELTFGQFTLVVSDGVVLCNLSGEVTAIDAKTGERLWQRPAAKHGFHEPLDIFVIDGLVWLGTERPDSVAPPAVNDYNQGVELHTGEVKVERPVIAELQTAGHHHRCYRERATSRYILASKRGVEVMDLDGDDHFRANWVRGSCQFGFIPANGLLYTPPHSCGCYMETKLRGFNALASNRTTLSQPQRAVSDPARLEKGPAYSQIVNRQYKAVIGLSSIVNPNDWPTYRHNPVRSAIASTEVPAQFRQVWSAELEGRLTQPVIAGGKVVVASIDKHTVIALNENNGKVAWIYTCGGRVDSPPTIHGDRLFFGSADGRVYCLSLDDGELIWRFTCSPMDVRAMAYNQVESLWPVHGSVLLLDGILYCAAGRSTWLDGGIYLFALDPLTGKVLHSYQYRSRHPEFENNKDKAEEGHTVTNKQNVTDYKTFLQSDRSDSFSMAAGTISDVLVSDGQDVFLHQTRFNAELEPQTEMSRHLFSTSSLLDVNENHRSHWVLGTGDFSRVPVAYSWIVNSEGARRRDVALAAPYGVLMVYDDQAAWGVRRNGKADGNYTLFRRTNRPFSESPKNLPDFRQLPEDEDPYPYEWKNAFHNRPRALVKSGDHLFIGTTPTKIPDDDPHAAYEGRLGGTVQVVNAETGEPVAAYDLDHPVVWDGMAAANQRLYLAKDNGAVICLGR